MNVFRLVLCLAGLVTFLVVRHFSAPTEELASDPLSSESIAPVFPVDDTAGSFAPVESQHFNLRIIPVTIAEYSFGKKTVWIDQVPQGLVYRVAGEDGLVLGQNLSAAQLQQLHPDLYRAVKAAQNSPLKQENTFGLRMRTDGLLK